MKDLDLDDFTHALPAREFWGDVHLAAGMNENNSAFDIPNSEGKEMKRKAIKIPKSIMIYCPTCSHHWLSANVPDDWWNARVEKCANCLGTGGRCKKCDEESKARRQRTVAA